MVDVTETRSSVFFFLKVTNAACPEGNLKSLL